MTIVKDMFKFSPTFRWGALFLLIVLAFVVFILLFTLWPAGAPRGAE